MRIKKKKKLNFRLLCGICAVVVALSLIVGGVFAWTDSSQYKSNIMTGGQNTRYDVVLVEDFERPDEWKQNDVLRNEVSVKNNGEGQIYIRLQLKEYMEVSEAEYIYSDEELLIDQSGKFVAYKTADELKTWLDAQGITYYENQIKAYTAYGDTDEKYYLAVGADVGVSIKKLLLDYNESAPESLVPGVQRADYEITDNHQMRPIGECLYTPHLWSGATLAGGKDTGLDKDPFHEYIEWTLGAPLLLLSEWDGAPVAAWIVDDASADGWVYWGDALKPHDSTAKLLKSIELIKQPAGPFYYALHVDLQAADFDQLQSEFIGMPQKIENSYRGKIGFAIMPDVSTITPGGTVRFTAAWNDTAVASNSVVWKVTNATASGLDASTKIDASGVLTVGQAQASGALIVTATYDSPVGIKTRQYIITVKAPAASAP